MIVRLIFVSQALVFIHGAELPVSQYNTLFTLLQKLSPLNLWVCLPGFSLDMPNPLEVILLKY